MEREVAFMKRPLVDTAQPLASLTIVRGYHEAFLECVDIRVSRELIRDVHGGTCEHGVGAQELFVFVAPFRRHFLEFFWRDVAVKFLENGAAQGWVVEREVESLKRAFGGTPQPLGSVLFLQGCENVNALCQYVRLKVGQLVVDVHGRTREHGVRARVSADVAVCVAMAATWHIAGFGRL